MTAGSIADPLDRRADTDGRLLAGNQIRLVDADGRDVPTGRDGEILSRGPELFTGYTDPALNAAAFLPGGWFRTGDVGRTDADGYLTVTDRLKDIIIRGGENISAKEVEDLLVTHPAVADVAVIPVPDPALGERVCAVVVARPGLHLRRRAGPGPLRRRRRRPAEDARGVVSGRRAAADSLGQGPQGRAARRQGGRAGERPAAPT